MGHCRRGHLAQLQCEAVGAARLLPCCVADGPTLPVGGSRAAPAHAGRGHGRLLQSIPVSTSLFRDASDRTSLGLAQRLARKTNRQVFLWSGYTYLIRHMIAKDGRLSHTVGCHFA